MESSTPTNGCTFPPLPYAYDTLEPYIDIATMELHHHKHHATYVNNLNASINNSEHEGENIEQLLSASATLPAATRNNGVGNYNPLLLCQLVSPDGA